MQTKINFELIEFLNTCFSILVVLRICTLTIITMIRKKFYCYRSYMGDFLQTLKRDLSANVFDKVYSLYLIHSVEDMLKYDDFEFFRARYKDIRVTFQQYVSGGWTCKIEY